ncbi:MULTISPECIES: DUF2590 family protein [unclassified Photorhabdus]|uniref:DUF2590 family protein n=1 Tax=unclassified Photorhabdus TaxID=2620880 RepID=UPI000DCF4061|nr:MULTISPECIES: DUF2590 family protein [unclassified Photorhabdus]RAW93264.1 hypothetical protein CKY03_22120 [Photorhabdus sp. S9-53]RAW93812.1 hypothetical protein CKY05_21760 [Photorhabdus sp. S10-54]RAW96927.1 hypothetical protein CKY04_22075 [Photorhabdus sp. S8-52]
MDEPKYIDLFINERNFTLNSGNEPRFCHNRVSIGQDCVHAIIESGLATKLIAERSPTLRADIRTQIEILVEDDERIIPGTIIINEESPTKLWIFVETYEFGRINVSVGNGN